MPLNSNQSKEFALHPVKCLRVSVFELSEWLPKPKRAGPSEWSEDNGQGIELPIATEV